MTGGATAAAELARETWLGMGSFIEVAVPEVERGRLPGWATAARARFDALEGELSIYKPESPIARLNAAAGRGGVAVGGDALRVLGLAVQYGQWSGGAFDPTVGPVMRLWGFNKGSRPDRPPGEEELRAALRLVGIRHVAISNEAGWAALDAPGVKVDLGGIAKGYAVDACFETMRAMGATNLMVNLAGNIRCGGRPGGRAEWKIGVRNPFEDGEMIGTLSLAGDRSVATSGNYERFVMIQGKRYAHIMDPRTGWPVTGMAGVTVLTTNALQADALSTSLFVLGVAGSRGLLERTGAEALFVPDVEPRVVWVTPGMGRYFTPSKSWAAAVRKMPARAGKQE